MTDADRQRIREKQNKLLTYCKTKGYPDNYKISCSHPGCPTFEELKTAVYPDWEWLLDYQLDLADQHVL